MVYITFPSTLTEEEETLKQKYAKLRKKVISLFSRSFNLKCPSADTGLCAFNNLFTVTVKVVFSILSKDAKGNKSMDSRNL